jgi:hypothetical protein
MGPEFINSQIKMKLDIKFNRNEDENGYATFTLAAPYRGRFGRRNPLLREIEIREWSSGSDGGLNHYMLRDKPVGRSVWRHSLKLEAFKSYDECKQDLLTRILAHLRELVPCIAKAEAAQ